MTRAAEGNRNALLALHFGEADARSAAAARAHVEGCPACREYLAALSETEEALRGWADVRPSDGLADRVLARATASAPSVVVRPAAPDAMPLLGLVPVMGVLVFAVRLMAARLAALPSWPVLEDWPALETVAPFAAAAAALFMIGALLTLALAPPLLLESAGRAGDRPRTAGIGG